MTYNTLPTKETIDQTIAALAANGIDAVVVKDRAAAKSYVLEQLPKGAEVMTMTSVTLDETGIASAVNESTDYKLTKKQLESMDRAKDGREMQRLGAAPEYVLGSVHAVTQDGTVVIASNTGSQLPAYAYGAAHVIWVVGAQKIVPNLDAAMDRLNTYILPKESQRAHEAYGVPASNISKLLIISREVQPKRLLVVFVEEVLGY